MYLFKPLNYQCICDNVICHYFNIDVIITVYRISILFIQCYNFALRYVLALSIDCTMCWHNIHSMHSMVLGTNILYVFVVSVNRNTAIYFNWYAGMHILLLISSFISVCVNCKSTWFDLFNSTLPI